MDEIKLYVDYVIACLQGDGEKATKLYSMISNINPENIDFHLFPEIKDAHCKLFQIDEKTISNKNESLVFDYGNYSISKIEYIKQYESYIILKQKDILTPIIIPRPSDGKPINITLCHNNDIWLDWVNPLTFIPDCGSISRVVIHRGGFISDIYWFNDELKPHRDNNLPSHITNRLNLGGRLYKFCCPAWYLSFDTNGIESQKSIFCCDD